ncbi:LacI family transcriptional regulator, partial [Paracidovorax avenae]
MPAQRCRPGGGGGKVVAIGFDGNDDLQKFVKDGTFEA